MPRFVGLKAHFATLAMNRSKPRLDRDTSILIFAVLLTLALVIFYVLTKIGA